MVRTIRPILILPVLFMLVFGNGCVVVEELPYNNKTERWIDDRLVGTWRGDDPETGRPRTIEIKRVEQRSYIAWDSTSEAPAEGASVFDLVRIGAATYMFQRPANYAPLPPDQHGYQFFKVEIEQDIVKISLPVPEQWRQAIARDKRALCVRDDPSVSLGIVINATPQKFQSFLVRNQKSRKLFGESVILGRTFVN